MKKMDRKRVYCRRFAAVVAMSTVLAGTTACGSDKKAGSGGDIVVGVIGQFSGTLASTYGGVPTALEAWEKSVNAAGGINGHKVRLKVEDVGETTGANVSAARSMITTDKVAAIITMDQFDVSWVKFAAKSSVPVISGIATPAPLISPDVFSTALNSVAAGYAVASEAKRLGKKFAIGYPAELPTAAQIVSTIKGFGKGLGLDVAVAAKLSSSAPDYTAFCQQLKSSAVDSFLLGLPGAVTEKVSQQCYQQEIRITQLLLGANVSPSYKTNPSFDGSIAIDGVAPYFDKSVPGVAEYRKALEKYEPRFVGSSTDTSLPAFAWASAKLFEKAAKSVDGDVTGKSLQAALYNIKNETLGGMTAPLTYTRGKTSPVNCWFTWKIEHGQYVASSGAKIQCAPDAVIDPILARVAKSLG